METSETRQELAALLVKLVNGDYGQITEEELAVLLDWTESRECKEVSSEPRGAEGLPLPGDPGFATPDVCEALMDRSFALRSDPEAMFRLAELAAQSAEELDTEVYGSESIADLQAHAWAEMANAQRMIGDLPKADRTMARAVDCRSRGTGDARLLARLCDLGATLACAQLRFNDAFGLLDSSYSIYIKLEDRHAAGRVLIVRGLYAGYTGDSLEGIRYLVHGLNTIDRVREPQLAFRALHYILRLRGELGENEEVRKMLQSMQPLYGSFLSDWGGGDADPHTRPQAHPLEPLRYLLQTHFPVLYAQVLEPTLADLRQEHSAALTEGHPVKARWILLQGCVALAAAAARQRGVSLLGRIAALWQAKSPK